LNALQTLLAVVASFRPIGVPWDFTVESLLLMSYLLVSVLISCPSLARL